MNSFNAEKCAQRRRLAARRDAVEAVPMHLFAGTPAVAADAGLLYAHGTLPVTLDAALERINALLPEGNPPLTADQVYVHYMEAANSNFVGDRFMFLDETTLRNIARDAQAGVAFMNSHATGGLSHPAELPMGRTFAGRYEHGTDGQKRALLGMYMLRGTAPNGASGPTTDDLHASIAGGTAFDVSVGLYGGQRVCDVCGNDVQDPKLCSHAPGTSRNMTPDQRTAQTARGVRGGHASYSLLHARMGEVSAVYDGAVPGAGFRKTLTLARTHQLSRADSRAAASAYAGLWHTGDLHMDQVDELSEVVENAFTRALKAVGFGSHRSSRALLAEAEPVELTSLAAVVAPLQPVVDPEKVALQAEVESLKANQRTEAARHEVDRWIAVDHKLAPAQNSDGQTTALLAFLLAAPGTIRLGNGADVTPAEAFRQVIGATPPSPMFTDQTPVQLLGSDPAPDATAQAAARNLLLLKKSRLGQQALKTAGKEQ